MRSFFLSLLLCAPLMAQQMNPNQVKGTAVVQNPAGSQTINQPSGTTLSVNRLHADNFTADAGSFAADQATIASLNANGWVVPGSYGTVSQGSLNTVTASGAGTAITVSAASDFAVKMGVMIPHGASTCGSKLGFSCATGPTPTLATSGTPGSTTYSYRLACITGVHGVGVAGTSVAINTGNATLSGVVNGTQLNGNFNLVSWTGIAHCPEVAIYRNGSFIATKYSSVSGSNTYADQGVAPSTMRDIPSTPPTVALNENYTGIITAMTGTSITLSPALGTTVSSATMYHSDTPLIQAAITASTFVNLPVGLYLVNYPINYTNIEPNPGFTMAGAIVGAGKMMMDTGDIVLDVTGDNNVVLDGFTMLQGPTAPSQIAIYCSRHSAGGVTGVSQNIITKSLILGFGGNANSLGGRGSVGFYNHACEIQHNYDDQFQVAGRWMVLTAGNIDQVSSPFDPDDDRSSQSMSQVDSFSLTGAGFVYAELDNAFSISFIGGYGLSGSPLHPWAFEVDSLVGRLTIDKFRVEVKGGLVDVANGGHLAEPYLDSDVYPTSPLLGTPQIRLNDGATISDADMIRADDYGGSTTVRPLIDGTNCAIATSNMRLGFFETIGTCQTSGFGNTISGTNTYDRSIPPTYVLPGSTTPTWIKLGTWISDPNGSSLGIRFYTGIGITAGSNNQSKAEAVIRNSGGVSAPNLSGAKLYSYGGAAITGIKVVATGGSTSPSNQSWDVYIDVVTFAGGNYIVEKEPTEQWISSNTLTADPGSASSSLLVGTVVQGVTKTCTVLPTVVDGIITGC